MSDTRSGGSVQPRCHECGVFTTEELSYAGSAGHILIKYCTNCAKNSDLSNTEMD